MDSTAVKAMMAEIAPVIREYVAASLDPVTQRIDGLERSASSFLRIEDAAATAKEVGERVATAMAEAIDGLPAPFDPAELVAENIELKGRIAELESRPVPDSVFVLQLVQDEIAKIPAPENGKDADPEQVASLVAETVERAVAALPVPQDGKDASGIVEALKDNGELVLTLQDGRLIRTGIRDGEKGKDGLNGFNLEDFDVERGDDGRTFVLKFERGDVRHEYELTIPVPVYCGIYKAGESYVPGDLVTWGGSLHHCDAPTNEKPDVGPWTVAVKKGRDGKDAKHG